jgi:hypothetical protein
MGLEIIVILYLVRWIITVMCINGCNPKFWAVTVTLLKLKSCGILCCVQWSIVTDISKEHSAVIFRMEQFKKRLFLDCLILWNICHCSSQQGVMSQKTWIVRACNIMKGLSIRYQLWNTTFGELWINEYVDMETQKMFFTFLDMFLCVWDIYIYTRTHAHTHTCTHTHTRPYVRTYIHMYMLYIFH